MFALLWVLSLFGQLLTCALRLVILRLLVRLVRSYEIFQGSRELIFWLIWWALWVIVWR